MEAVIQSATLVPVATGVRLNVSQTGLQGRTIKRTLSPGLSRTCSWLKGSHGEAAGEPLPDDSGALWTICLTTAHRLSAPSAA